MNSRKLPIIKAGHIRQNKFCKHRVISERQRKLARKRRRNIQSGLFLSRIEETDNDSNPPEER
ncbi:MAG: hypothetical protein HFG28_04875 [Eubacterium sp.]|nr:hypothetical protein [Eubacterium sp.]